MYPEIKEVKIKKVQTQKEKILSNSNSSTDSDEEVTDPGSGLNKSSSLKIQETLISAKEVFDKMNEVIVVSESYASS